MSKIDLDKYITFFDVSGNDYDWFSGGKTLMKRDGGCDNVKKLLEELRDWRNGKIRLSKGEE